MNIFLRKFALIEAMVLVLLYSSPALSDGHDKKVTVQPTHVCSSGSKAFVGYSNGNLKWCNANQAVRKCFQLTGLPTGNLRTIALDCGQGANSAWVALSNGNVYWCTNGTRGFCVHIANQ